jgi:hypothetical protein
MEKIMERPNRRPCINTRTDNFHFSVSFHPDTGLPIEFFITGRGKVGQQLDEELYELSVKTSKLMQGEYDDLPRLSPRNDPDADRYGAAP